MYSTHIFTPPRTSTTMANDEILDAINEGRFASAKRELALKLKRFPQSSHFWALNCYYLYATGETEEAVEQCRILKQKVPSDAQALDLLYSLYGKLGMKAEANEVYENAIRKYPSTDLILTFFNKAVDHFDTKTMQKSAMQLQRHAKSNRLYGIRAAFTNFLLSSQSTSEKESSLYLGLALGLIEKAQPLQSEQETYVHAVILEKQEKYETIIELLQPLEHRELEVILIYLRALDIAEKWQILYLECHKLLFAEKFNDFDTWKYLIKAAKKLDKPAQVLYELIKFDSRNSYMANIEISKVYGAGFDEALANYYEKFSSKQCLIPDLSTLELPQNFYDKVQKVLAELTKKDTLTAQEAATLFNTQRLLLLQEPSAKIDCSIFEHHQNPELSDLYLLDMAQSLKEDRSPQNVIKHIVHLEFYAGMDPENYKLRLWLLNLYTSINASSLALKAYKDLKIKMIQHDTLSYKLDLEPSVGSLNELVQTFRFYLTSDNEVAAFVDNAFQGELYTKLEDFLRFGERLSKSLSRHLLTVRILKFSRILNNDYYHYFSKALKESKAAILSDDFSLFDNRDFKTDYNLGIEVLPLRFYETEQRRGTNYVRLCYLKELLLVEKKESEITKLLKLFNKWLSNPDYVLQLSSYESHMFKLYLSLFKLVKVPNPKDKVLLVNFLVKNLDFNKVKLNFISKLPPLTSTLNHILVETFEFVRIVQVILREPQLLNAVKKLHTDLTEFNASDKQIEYLRSTKNTIAFGKQIPETFIDDQLEALEDGLKKSAFRIK